MNSSFEVSVLRALLYYDIWSYPLSAKELFAFLPVNSMSFEEFQRNLELLNGSHPVRAHEGYFFVRGKTPAVVTQRLQRERHARRLWRIARLMAHVIRRFPFVRGIFVSGDLSKNATHRKSDIDFFILTEPDRLWISRTLLILFKKVFLLNRKKFFCLNYFATTNHLRLDEENVFLATEVAHLKPMYNNRLFFEYMEANSWIKKYFPNFDLKALGIQPMHGRQSLVQRLAEAPFGWFEAKHLDEYIRLRMERVWSKRYPEFDELTRQKIFRCTREESRTFVGNFEDKILALYEQKLKEFGVSD